MAFLISIAAPPALVFAASSGNVEMSVTVQEKTPTDTIDDFDLSALKGEQGSVDKGKVAGISATQKNDSPTLYLIILLTIGITFFLSRKLLAHVRSKDGEKNENSQI